MSETLSSELSRFERAALSLTRATNERPLPKWLQLKWLRTVSHTWVRRGASRRALVEGLEWMRTYEPDRGVVLASNHRSFFDMYIVMLSVYENHIDWPVRLYFPVRSNFFYERPLGVLVNFAVGGGSMYPPIFRDRTKAALNKDALARTVEFLRDPGTVVGVHPEGTRGKGSDPYELLPAQPGVGQIILQARPVLVPVFVNGLGNDILRDIAANYAPNVRRENPIIIVFGEPLDYSDLAAVPPRPALYKRMSDRARDAIIELSKRERALREQCARGEVPDDDPRWLENAARLTRGGRRSNGAR